MGGAKISAAFFCAMVPAKTSSSLQAEVARSALLKLFSRSAPWELADTTNSRHQHCYLFNTELEYH